MKTEASRKPVPMEQGVSRIECVGDFVSNTQQLLRIEWPASYPVLQSGAFEVLHHDEGATLIVIHSVASAAAAILNARVDAV
jgi:hypothetical protein